MTRSQQEDPEEKGHRLPIVEKSIKELSANPLIVDKLVELGNFSTEFLS